MTWRWGWEDSHLGPEVPELVPEDPPVNVGSGLPSVAILAENMQVVNLVYRETTAAGMCGRVGKQRALPVIPDVGRTNWGTTSDQ